jgi:hypothetical protein
MEIEAKKSGIFNLLFFLVTFLIINIVFRDYYDDLGVALKYNDVRGYSRTSYGD